MTDTLAEYRDAFALFDKTGDGKLAYGDFADCLRALGADVSNSEVLTLLNNPTADEMETKTLTFEEFLPMYQKILTQSQKGNMKDFIEGLRVFDTEGSGLINSAELRHALASLLEFANNAKVDQLFAQLTNADDKVNYEEFIEKVMMG